MKYLLVILFLIVGLKESQVKFAYIDGYKKNVVWSEPFGDQSECVKRGHVKGSYLEEHWKFNEEKLVDLDSVTLLITRHGIKNKYCCARCIHRFITETEVTIDTVKIK